MGATSKPVSTTKVNVTYDSHLVNLLKIYFWFIDVLIPVNDLLKPLT